jgi:hypothetical protein
MNGEVLRAASYGDAYALDRAYRAKSINILRAARGYRYYLEANQLFIKTFVAHAARDFGSRLAVIHLVRPPVDVAMSIYRLQRCPGTEPGNRWTLDYRAPLNRIRVADALEGELSHPYYKALWYWFEVETRIREWQQKLPGVPFVRFQTEWLNDSERVCALAHELGVSVDRQLIDSLAGVKENVREHVKLIPPLPAVEAQRMLEDFIGLISRRCPEAVAYTERLTCEASRIHTTTR